MKKIRTFVQSVLMLAALGVAAYSSELRAEDIDIYFENSSGGELPKVLFIIDNSANIGSIFGGGGCAGYADKSGAPSMGIKTAGGIVQCALADAISTLPNNTLDVGIMVGNANNFARGKGCVGSSGGCLLVPFTTIKKTASEDTRTPIIDFIKSWQHQNADSGGSFPFTVTNAESGGMMQEAYAYFYAKTGLSGRTYTKPWIQACQKNFIIYIGNMDKTPANEDPSGAALVTAGAGEIKFGTGTLKDKITTTQTFNPSICPEKITTFAAGNNQNDWSNNWADEWARFLQFKDGGTATQLGKQNVVTYTIGIIDNASNQCTAPYPALLNSMAKVTGGEAFRVGDAGAVKEAVANALNEAQAINSVFSSASLPVSVNAEGSYLNQIFLGMFRPDATGAPRWLGNLKQYQLIRDSSGNLVMGDATKKAAINSSTGFLSPNAISFWTYKDTGSLPDSIGGFFVNDKKGEPESGFDYPDGEVVEKGGVAQQLRKQSLVANFTGASGTSGNPRRVFTYCPSGTGCQQSLLHVDNDFATTNGKIQASDFGGSVTVFVDSIVRNGPVATITTRTSHGFRTGSLVTITGASDGYNLNGTITLVSGSTTQFTMAIKDLPTPTTKGQYTVGVPGGAGSKAITRLDRATRDGPTIDNTELVTVTTALDHGFVAGQGVAISGTTSADYNNRTWKIESVPATNQFTFKAAITPVSPTLNTYQAAHVGGTTWDFSSIAPSGGSSKVTTTGVHPFKQGQTVKISGLKGQDSSYYDSKEFQITSVATDGRSFAIATPSGATKTTSGAKVALSTTLKDVIITRTTTAVTGATATVSAPASWFADGNTVSISATGTNANESAYVKQATITCTVSDCSRFTYPITVTPAVSATGGSVAVPNAGTSVDLAAGAIVRTGTIAEVTLPTGTFLDGATITISPNGTALEDEAAYVGTWTVKCVTASPCSKFTIDPIPLSPPLTASGANIQAFSGNTPPDLGNLIKWLRGEDNHGDEKSPDPAQVKVRPSVHGDVLHSRPLVLNYNDDRGIVVFYGSNDGIYRAVNGNQSTAAVDNDVTVQPGGEFWGLILPEHYGNINRYRSNLPEVMYPGTFSSTAQPKNYFVDGPTGVYQRIDANGVITEAIIYLTMRRGGRFVYAIDVTHPAAPKVLFRLSSDSATSDKPGYEELGYSWSRPRVTLLQNLVGSVTRGGTTYPNERIPVLVFGAGYDPAQDSEPPITKLTQPPAANTMGRGIFVVNALTGEKIFSASASCDGTASCRKVPDMKYATPSDITFVDRDLDGFIDKFYWGDTGGNLWRLDVAGANVADWTVTKVAALGCDTGECSTLKTPRKFFYPPAVLSVRVSGTSGSYDMLSIVSGDREHPLTNDVDNSAYRTKDRFFMIKDYGTSPASTSLNTKDVVPNQLFNATYTNWDKSDPGFYIDFIGAGWNDKTRQPDASLAATLGEKAVNAPVAVNGQIFFSTNQPKTPDGTCAANLGTARAYAINPFSGAQVQNELEGGGLPPSAVSGLITITETVDGQTTTTQEKFCIGCGISGTEVGGTNDAPCTSALENCNIGTTIPKNLKRTYWYKK